jgi:hypothetical protein
MHCRRSLPIPTLVLALLLSAVLASACAPMCREMAADRETFFGRRAVSTTSHATIFLPFGVANRLMERRLAAVKPLGAPIALPGPVGKLIGSVRLAPRKITLGPAPEDRLGVRLAVDFLSGEKSLFTVTTDLQLRPEVDTAKGLLVVGLRADDLKAVKIDLGPDAGERLAAELRSRLPSFASSVLSQGDVASMAKAAIDLLAGQLGTLLAQSRLLSPLGEIVRFTVEIPLVPVARLSLRSLRQHDGLLVGITTALPVADGVSMDGDLSTNHEDVYLRLSGDALAELGNWALTSGLLPRRYDEQMHPKEDGDFTPGLRWIAGPRPFKLFAWRLKKPCLRTRIGAEPIVAIKHDKLEVGFDEGVLEEVEGAALVQARVWMKRIGADAIHLSRKTVSSASISIAGAPLVVAVRNAFYRSNTFNIELGLE